MKRLLYLFALIGALVTTSCSSEMNNEMPEVSRDSVYVTLNFAPSYEVTPMTRATTSDLSLAFSHLRVYITNTLTHETLVFNQSSSDEHFGSLIVGLAKANHIIKAIGYNTEPTISDLYILSYPENTVYDTFYKQYQLDTNYSVECSISLDRLVGKFKLCLNDNDIPNLASKIRITHTGTSVQYDLQNGGMVSSFNNTPFVEEFTVSSSNKTFEFLTFVNGNYNNNKSESAAVKMQLTVEALTSDNIVIETRTIANAPMYPGCVTTYSGSLFSSAYGSITCTVDPDWTNQYNKTF